MLEQICVVLVPKLKIFVKFLMRLCFENFN